MTVELNLPKSMEIFKRAKKSLPGGVTNFFRVPPYVPCLMFIERGKGSHVWDVDGNEYIDYRLSFGPLILGHSNDKVNNAVKEQLEKGTIYGVSHELEIKVAEKIVDASPCSDLVWFINTGSEATQAAIRIARAYSNKEKIVKFDLCYHSWYDWNMVGPGPWAVGTPGLGLNRLKISTSPGVTENAVRDTIVLPWNDVEAVEKTIRRHGDEIAAIIVEPISSVPPADGFLKFLREITQEHDVLLIFDEVKTGFRIVYGGAQEFWGVVPDLATYAKAMANGFPVAAVGGKREVMQPLAEGNVFLHGTFNGSPLCLAAALATLTELESNKDQVYKRLSALGDKLENGMEDGIEDAKIDAIVVRIPNGGTWPGPLLFTGLEKITNLEELNSINVRPHKERSELFIRHLLKRGVMSSPKSDPWFLSTAHTEEDIDTTISAIGEALKEAKKAT